MSRYFTDEHEWVDVEGEIATIGITDYAQGQLGDIVFVELPAEGATFDKGDDAAVVGPGEIVHAGGLFIGAGYTSVFFK